jgi:hypothetical protein
MGTLPAIGSPVKAVLLKFAAPVSLEDRPP